VNIGHETKENIRVFKDLFNELETFENDATTIIIEHTPLNMYHNGDMTTQWKLTNNGNSPKRVELVKECHSFLSMLCAP
jgi:hypothetical protein